MNRKQKKLFFRILSALFLMISFHFIPAFGACRLGLYIIPYLVVGYDILKKAFLGIFRRQLFDENFLMATATVGAFIIAFKGNGDYVEAVAVMLFYQTGELFQSYAVGKSRKNILALMDIRPDYANLERDGEIIRVSPDEVMPGEIITVMPGEKIPIDGIVVSGETMVDTSALTGESVPGNVVKGDEILSGCICMNGVIKVKTTKLFLESTASRILDLVENASSRKSRSEAFISRFSRVYTPFVCIMALALAILPPAYNILLTSDNADWHHWIYRALTFLVVSCPCALVISIPLSFFAGLGGAGKAGILIKGSNYLEALAKIKCVVFDKTGTLTSGNFEVTQVYNALIDKEKLIEYASHAEYASMHPIAKSIIRYYGKEIDTGRVTDINEWRGKGISAIVDGRKIIVGNSVMMNSFKIPYPEIESYGTVVHVAIDMIYSGSIVISDTIKTSSAEAVRELYDAGVKKTVMLTGDNSKIAKEVAKKTGIDEFSAGLLPEDKVNEIEKYIKAYHKTAFVGDGINDAPVLSRADVGIAMGALGSDAAIEAADVVLMDDNPLKIAKAVRISKKCIRIVYQNCVFAIGIKLVCLFLSALGYTGMGLAVFADVGVMMLAVLNAIRALFVKNV